MAYHNSEATSGQEDEGFDLGTIFIGRQQQLDLFEIFLQRWQRRLAQLAVDNSLVTAAPAPNNKLQGLVVLLYGRGGFGKSTLLKHYREMALQAVPQLAVSKTVDWEFAVEGNRSIFNPGEGQQVPAADYYHVLCGQFAGALNKPAKEFKNYRVAVENVERAKKDAHAQLDSMQRDDRYGWLRGLAVETISSVVRTYVPGGKAVVENKVVVDAANAAAKLTQEQIGQVRTALHNKLGRRLGDYLDPALQLGLALGSDLQEIARNFPLLICFDTYEEVDEGDRLLRIVMAAAGARVGWVLAGRDNLWAGAEQRERSLDIEYGYKDLVPADRGLSVNFNSGDVGAFTLNDIQEYFDLICQKTKEMGYQPALPNISEEQANSILAVTQGVPLAVKIAAGLYVETASMETITAAVEGKREIVDQMVRRYLLHTKANQAERFQLYGLALLRRADNPAAVAAALGLSAEQARVSYSSELSRLHRRYSFIFTEKEQPSLHQEVRHFLRLWLLEHRREPEIVAIIEHLRDTFATTLATLEEQMNDNTLKERMQDDEWVGTYLDLTEQNFWLNPTEGVKYALPFMIAAAIYRREINEDVADLGSFFEHDIKQPYEQWWTWATHYLISNRLFIWLVSFSLRETDGLEGLVKLAPDRCPIFPKPIPDYRQELEAALWWRLAESYGDNEKALTWYELALSRLGKETELCEATAEVCYEIGSKLDEENKYTEGITFLNRAIELKSDNVRAYIMRGDAYCNLKEYERAIADYTQAIVLDPNDGVAYNNRGSAYCNLKEYERAIADYTQAIVLDPNDGVSYNNRGYAYDALKEYERAIADYTQAIALDPNYALAYYNRGTAYTALKEYELAIADYTQAIVLDPNDGVYYHNRGYSYIEQKEYEQAVADYTQAIALDPEDAVAYHNRGYAYSEQKEYKRAIADYTQAIVLDPSDGVSYHTRGYASLSLGHVSDAQRDFNHTFELDPTDVNAAWMAEWAGMGKQRAGEELVILLAEIAAIDVQHYVAYVCRGVALGLRRKVKEGLAQMEQAIQLEPEQWDAFFWKAMLMLYYYQKADACEKAVETLRHALTLKLPPLLLTPLYWLEADRPEVFARYAKPLLDEYGV